MFLLLVIGGYFAIFQPWNEGVDEALSPDAAVEEGAEAGYDATIITEAVVLESGWIAPDVTTSLHADHLGASLATGLIADSGELASSNRQNEGGAQFELLELDDIDELNHSDLIQQLLAPGAETHGARIRLTTGKSKSLILSGLAGAHIGLRSFNLGAWSSWELMTSSPFEGPDGGEGTEGSGEGTEGSVGSSNSVGPIWLAGDVKAVEVIVVGGEAPTALTATILESTGAATNDLVPAGPSTADDGTPVIIDRSKWANAGWDYDNEDCDNGPLVADNAAAIVLHHTVTDNGYLEGDVPDLIRSIYHRHVAINGWCDIGYNYIVDRFGRVWEARTGSNQDLVIGGHAKGFNTGTIGIAMLGQFQSEIEPEAGEPDLAMTSAVTALVEAKVTEHGIDPTGNTWLRNRSSEGDHKLGSESWHYVPTILAHQDLGVTSCPGDHSLAWLRSLPTWMGDRRDRKPPYQSADWTPKGNGPGFVVVDQRGGLRSAGSASAISDVVDLSGEDPTTQSSIVAVEGEGQSGYSLTSEWTLVPYGGAPPLVLPNSSERGSGQPPADLVLRSDARSGWVLDQAGTLLGFGGVNNIAMPASTTQAVAAAVNDDGRGYVLYRDGTISAVGDAAEVRTKAAGVNAVDIVIREGVVQKKAPKGNLESDDVLGWAVAEDGTVTSFSSNSSVQPQVTKLQSENGRSPQTVRAIAAAPGQENGGWILDVNGQLWPFGGARHIGPFYGDATIQDAVDMVEVGITITPDFLASDKAVYVAALYQLFQGRPATPEEIDLGVSALEEGLDRSDLAELHARSDHWAGSEIESMYREALGRPADSEGKRYWVDQVRDGLQYQKLGLYFYGSTEYITTSGSNEGFVRRSYRDLLNREPDEEGFGYWTGILNSDEAEPPVVTESFYASIESRTARARRLHRTILGVDIEKADHQEWADKLLEIDDLTLAAEIAGSGDYYDLIVLGETP